MVALLRRRRVVDQQKRGNTEDAGERASQARGKPRRYRVHVASGLPEDIGQRVAELHAAAVLATTAGPQTPSRDNEEGTSDGRGARTEEEDS